MRPIDADAYIERINKTFNESPRCESFIGEALAYVVLKGIEGDLKNESKTPTIDITQRWIPISERLPDPEQNILICDKDNSIYVGYLSEYYTDDGETGFIWIYDECIAHIFNEVKAWMPLPEPYKE